LRSVGDPRREVEIDLEVAPPTRGTTDMQGGDGGFEIDHEVAARLYASHARGAAAFRAVGAAGQAYLERAVRYLTDDAGVDQFVVIGSSISGRANVHELTQAIVPASRVVYVLFDPVMLVYAHRLLRGAAEGTTAYVQAKLRDVDRILRRAGDTLDLSQPVAVLMPTNLAYVRDAGRAATIVRDFMDPLAPGSHLVLSHHASDLLVDEVAPVYRTIAELAAEGRAWDVAPRSKAEIAALLGHLELVEPGVVPIERWRPADPGPDPGPMPLTVAVHGAVARK
jgi:hypothetical protein